MKTENTYDRQTAKFIATLIQNIPDMPGDVMQGWIENPKALQKALGETLCPQQAEPKSSLRPLGITHTLPAQSICLVAQCFTDKNVFAYRDGNFDELLSKTLPASAETKVSGHELTKITTEADLAKAGGKFTNLLQIENFILRTEKGKGTGLLAKGYANLFFLQVGASVFTVNALRGSGGWGVHCFRFFAGLEWAAERRFFSPAT